MWFIRSFVVCVALLSALSPSSAHEWEEMALMPDIILERMVEIMEAAAEADRFEDAQPENCVPQHCLEQILMSATDPDFDWLATAPESEIPSDLLGRLPANVTYEWLFGLVQLLDHGAPTPEQSALIERLEQILIYWTQP